MSNDGNTKIEKIMNDTWSNRAIKNAKKYIALSSWKTEEEFDRSGLLAARRILRKLPEDKICNLNVLEIGGGIGRITKHMSKYVKEITMVDVSSEMAELARKRIDYLRNVNIYKTDGVKLPFPDNSFDIVYSIFVFQHMPRYIFLKNLADISRVLKNNGIFIFQIFEKEKNI